MVRAKRRALALTGAAILIAAVIIVAVAHTPAVNRYALERLQAYLRTEYGIELKAGRVRPNLFRLSLLVEKASLSSVATPDLPPLIEIERANLRMGLMGLLRGPVAVQAARLDGVKITVLTEKNGRSNIPSSPSPKPFEELPDFLIDSLEIAEASFSFEDRRHGLRVELPGLHAQIDGNPLTLNHDLLLRATKQGFAIYQNRSLAVDRLDLAAQARKRELILESLGFSSSNSQVSGSGSIKNFADPVLDFNVQTNLDLSEIDRLAGLEEKLRGAIRARVSLTGSLKEIRVSGQVGGSGLTVAGYDQIGIDTSVGWDSSARRLRLERFDARSPDGSAQGAADLALDREAGISSIQARVNEFELQRIMRLFHLPVRLASRVTGDVRAKWQGLDYSRLNGDSRLRLTASRPGPARDVLPVSASLSFKFQDDRIQALVESASLLEAKARGQVSVKSMDKIEGQIEGSVESIEGLLSQISLFLGREERLINVDLVGAADFSATLQGTLERPMVIASVEAPRLRIGELTDASVKVAAEIDRSSIRLKEVMATVAGQTLHARGVVGLETDAAPLDIEAWVDQGSIAPILSALKVQIPAEGIFQASAHLSGQVNALAGELRVSASNLKLYDEPLGALGVEARLAGNRLETTRFFLDKTPGDSVQDFVEAKLAYDFQSGQYSLRADGKDLTLEQLKLPGEIPMRGKVSFAASGQGTIENPLLDLKLDVADLEVRNQTAGPVKASATLRGREATVEARAPRLALTSTARIGIEPPYPAQLKVQAEKTDLSLLGIQVGGERPLGGNLEAAITASGNLSEWKDGTATAQVRDLRVTLRDREIRNRGAVAVDYQGGLLRIQPATFVSQNSEVQISGTMPIDERDATDLSVKARLDVGQIFPFLPAPPGLYVTGDLNLDLRLAGTPSRLKASGPISLANGFLHYPALRMPLAGITLTASLENGSLVVTQATAEWSSAKLALSGELPLGLLPEALPVQFERKNAPGRLSASLEGLQLQSTGELPAGVTGVLGLHATVEAPRMDLAALTANVTSDQLKLQLEDYVVQQAQPASVVVRDGLARIENFRLTGPETKIELSGTAGLEPGAPLDLRLEGDMDAGILTFMTKDLRAAGATQVRVNVGGTLTAPEVSGFVQLADGQASLTAPKIAADNLDIRLNLTRDRMTIEKFSGNVNGGSLQATGSAGYAGGEPQEINIDASLENVFLNFPEGLKTRADAGLKVRSAGRFIEIGGEVRIQEGSYKDPLKIEGELLNYLRSEQTADLGQEPNPLLSRIRYNIAVVSQGPIVVDNNLAKLVADANLRLVGSYYHPSVTGRIAMEEGGEIRLNERSYLIERGIIDFTNQTQIEPNLDIQATTKVKEYDVTLRVSGSPKTIKSTLTSDPALPEPDIISLLLTGRPLEEFRGEELTVAKEQALSYLAGAAGQKISGGAQRALGLSSVRIEPHLISAESDPSARLTVGQDITNKLHFVYSMNLTDSSDQIWIAEYDLSRRFNTRGIKQEDNSYRLEFQHDLRFGGPSALGKSERPARRRKEIGSIDFAGSPVFSEKVLSHKLGYKAGDRYDFFKLQKRIDRLQEFYAGQGRLEAKIRLDRQTKNDTVDLKFNIKAGPELEFTFEGFDVSKDVREEVRRVWRDGVFDAQRGDEAIQAIRRSLVKEGYLQATVEYAISGQEDREQVRFSISPGTRFREVELAFEGASGINPDELEKELVRADLKLAVYTEPRKVIGFLTRFYQRNGYLQAKINSPRLELDAATGSGKVSIPIQEGRLFKIGSLDFTGNQAFPDEKLKGAVPLSAGEAYKPELVSNSVAALQRFYWSNGYHDVEISYRTAQDPAAGLANLSFEIAENRKAVVQEIVLEGNTKTGDGFVRRQVNIEPGEALDLEKISRARKNLYETGVYSLADLETEEIQGSPAAPGIKPVRIRVKLKEVEPYRFRYGGFFDTERGPGFIADAAHRNLLGRAAILGLRTRYDMDLREARLYFSQPGIRGIPFKTDATAFLRREISTFTDDLGFPKTFITDRAGFSIQQEKRLKNSFLFNYGYRFERAHTFDKEPNPDDLIPFDITLPVARLVGTLTRDTRDHVLDATRGSFTSHGFEFASKKLGSDLAFLKYYGQYFHYRPLSDPKELPRGQESRFVYAGGLRLGLIKALGGQDVIRSERFFAGGGTTLRGFKQNGVGPKDDIGVPAGGEAVFLVNNEVRFPLFSIFDGVGFVDLGNVYATISDFNPFSIRKAAGFGIRVRTGFLLLRLDLGVKLDRKPGESLTGLFFSIGQAF